ncbi:esa1-associated factor [Zygosaccharomyces mellis]|uniref:Chromatin modification-related protein EAF7 n=1 Tax=Zygosaccharomyces mellis TaxID=42258 RepID=A0A4C2E7U4_9SACH|nr:esa1-associated factor [Zygosaccharomyces mellis]
MAVDWTKVDEIRLLRWVAEFKPAGLHKHFHMYCIVERMNRPDKYPVVLLQKETVKSGKIFTASEIWEKLTQYYDLDTMDRTEGGELFDENKDFELPWDEYGDLILDHAKGEAESEGEDEKKQEIKREDPLSVTDAPQIHDIEKEDQPNTSSGSINNAKRRSTRLRKSSRLNHSGSASDDEDVSNVGSGGSEPDGEEEGIQTDNNENKVNKRDQPLAKRTRHSASATTNTTDNEVSPRRKKRKPDEATPPLPQIVKQEATPASTQATPPVRTSSRVSSRLRNKK